MNFIFFGIAIFFLALVGAGLWGRARLSRNFDCQKAMDPRLGLSQFVRPYRVSLGLAAILIIVQTFFDLAAPWPLKVAVDNVIGGKPFEGWMAGFNGFSTGGLGIVVVSAGVILIVASGVIGYFATYLIGAAGERVGADIRSAAFGRLQHQSLGFHDRNRTGDLVTRLTSDITRVQDVLISWFQTLIPELLAVLGMLAVLVALDLQMALAALGVLPLLAIQILISRRGIKNSERAVRDHYGRLAAHATDVLRNVRAVQAFSREHDEEQRFRSESTIATKSALTALDVRSRYAPTSDLILALGSGLILFLGIMRVVNGYMTLGTLLVILTYPVEFLSSASFSRSADIGVRPRCGKSGAINGDLC